MSVGAGAVGSDGFEVVVSVKHSDEEFLDAQAQRNVRIVPVETPLEDGIDNLAVLFDSLVGGAVGFFVAMQLINSACTGLDISKFRVPLDFRKVVGLGAFGKDEAEHQESKVAVRLQPPMLA